MIEEKILDAYTKLTIPRITTHIELDDDLQEVHYIRLILPYHPKLICLIMVTDDILQDDKAPEIIAKLLKHGIESKFDEDQELERLSKRRLIRFIRWLFHY